jgi:DNA-binding NarL/FixJ family response regulator
MLAINEKLETLFEKVRALPAERQEAAVEALAEIAAEGYALSNDELSVLEPALERAQRGEYASDAEVTELLGESWR